MNALVKGEYDKLTPYQQLKFQELSGWQTAHNPKQQLMSDASLFKVIEWVENLQEPVAESTVLES